MESSDANLYGDPFADDQPLEPVGHPEVSARLVPAGDFILDAPDNVPAIWGDGDQVVWADGEALILAGPPGVGKTTLVGQIFRARLLGGTVLGMPVERTSSRVLYLAMDRPQQIARALRRTLGTDGRDMLNARGNIWPGPPPADVAKHPEILLGLAEMAGADTVIVDSLKDAAVGLEDGDVGAGYNRARQLCLANGVQVVELHHTKKRGANGEAPKALADLYGSVWITAGAGSVVLLWGDAGDPIVEWHHLKQPAAEVGPFKVIHDHDAGVSSMYHTTDLLALARASSNGVTAKDAAKALFDAAKPKPNEVEKARRRLDKLTKSGHLTCHPGDDKAQIPTVWTRSRTLTVTSDAETVTESTDPSRTPREQGDSTLTDTLTPLTQGDPHARPLPLEGGASGSSECGFTGCTEPARPNKVMCQIHHTREPAA